ncbi:hypothetical protein F3Y22_tig00013960pilonHSYRG00205 [Hibiscus syriacus]|uniref:Uncharacterized protein n=1 Tax=Hibiscus syriacus TaxID=106335 RepID=A0A6A3C133_HIBSY|nr:hypothetical protein F3Y22_tig00013960pilonHSYRG00205 [Hibiscus syriacus]
MWVVVGLVVCLPLVLRLGCLLSGNNVDDQSRGSRVSRGFGGEVAWHWSVGSWTLDHLAEAAAGFLEASELFPDCAPYSVAYILEFLKLRHCAGCQFYRAEGRGQSWDSEGNHIKDAPYGLPLAPIQGILEAQGTP